MFRSVLVPRLKSASRIAMVVPVSYLSTKGSVTEPERGWLGSWGKSASLPKMPDALSADWKNKFDLGGSEVMAEAMAGIKRSVEPYSIKEKLGLSSSAALAMRLQQTMEQVMDRLGEPSLPADRAFPAFRALAQAYDTKIFAKAVGQMTDTRPVTVREMEDVERYFPLAHAAYLPQGDLEVKLKELGWHMLYHDSVTKAGERTAHFVAYDIGSKKVVVAVTGTSDLNDVITDCVCTPVALSRSGKSQALAHEAMTVAAYGLMDRLGYVLKELFEPQDFEVLVVGHSLGAGTATLLAMLLRHELGMRMVRGIGYATPPVVDKKTAVGSADFITSVAHQNDVITVSSVANLERFGTVIAGVDTALNTGDQLLSSEECNEILVNAISVHKDNAEDMYVPGKVVYVSHDGADQEEGLSLIHISEPTRLLSISYAVFCLKKKKSNKQNIKNK
eukprot:TRINITY_DN28674_c0_g1_i2.p1 TRINITY_DN28674_c0_g1~~TRINITY_DN28674_c0_g1_i2.p1  ORF type:complete len:447 (-),score=118.64 TRINITY_DN28674_c0_g1_i2:67-1407(-)